MSGTRKCRLCNVEKVWADFPRHPKGKNGRAARCKACHKKENRQRYHFGSGVREVVLAQMKAKRLDVEWRAANLARQSNYALMTKFGITLADKKRMLQEQGCRCAICESVIVGRGRRQEPVAVVDHCHTRGHIRGLLCVRCNTGLGQFRDRPDFLRKAILYLRRDWHGKGGGSKTASPK